MAFLASNQSKAALLDDPTAALWSAWFHPVVTRFRRMFVLVSPAETSFGTVEEVPDYVAEATPYFLAFVVMEMVLQRVLHKGRPTRINDAISSVTAGLMSLLPKILARSIELSTYVWVWENFHQWELPWDQPMTWWLCFLGVDLAYYFVHRAGHEVNFMWAAHQAHHSSEEYNLSTALRQSVLQKYNSWIFYMPMALAIPPSIFLVHVQFNLLYQFWIHTELVDSLGPLEYILNTPSHHRVHHGRNRYCIDKNYGGTLIIWDRLFGTFVAEGEEVVYGLTHPLNCWDAIHVQLCHWKHILRTAWNIEGFWNKVFVFIKGPGWEPGKPRTGLIEDIPDVHAPQPCYDQSVPAWFHVYTLTHLGLAVILQHCLKLPGLSPVVLVLGVLYILWTLTDIGYLYEHKWYASWLELFRCVVYLAVDFALSSKTSELDSSNLLYIPRCIFMFSLSLWIVHYSKTDEKATKVE